MNNKKTILSFSLIFLLLFASCCFAKPKTRSRPVRPAKARVEKSKIPLINQETGPFPFLPQQDENLEKEWDSHPDDGKTQVPQTKEKIEQREPALPVLKTKPDKLQEKSTPERKKRPAVEKPKPSVEKTKPSVEKPKPSVEKPKPSVEKTKKTLFSQPGRFPTHFRAAPGNHQWDNRNPHRYARRYRGSSYFYPHFPRYYYDSWILVQKNTRYTQFQLPEQLRITIGCGNFLEFELEKIPNTGYRWMASYDAYFSRIDIIHPRNNNKSLHQSMFSDAGKATVQIETLNPGTTMVELIYIRPWEFERGDEPAKRIQILLDIAPE